MRKCLRCGRCCKGSPCGLAEKVGLSQKKGGPCVALRWRGGPLPYACGLIEEATPEQREEFEYALKIGEGCHLWQ